MKKALVVDVRKGQDKEKQNNVLYITLYKLPSKMKDGALWHPKKDEAVVIASFSEKYAPEDYNKLQTLPLGSICDIVYGVNDFNDKTFIAKLNVVVEGVYTDKDLY